MKIEISDWFKRITDLMHEGIIIVDQSSDILFINKAYEDFTGLKREDVIGKSLKEFRPNSLLPEILIWKKPLYDALRFAANKESFCDFIPITDNNENVIGGMVVIRDTNQITSLAKTFYKQAQRPPKPNFANSFTANFTFDNIIGRDTGLKQIVTTGYKATMTDSPVLLIGESGTGKEVLAQAIHNGSDRKEYPFIDVNCAALPESLLESEFFGYQEGAFTGGVKAGKKGLFELANGGTIFLDEVTEMPYNLQAKLLRVLQEKSIRRVGGQSRIDLDVRIIAATNKNIFTLMEEKKFRQDFYFRLAVFVINIPPLRDRREDIPLFIEDCIAQQQTKKRKLITIHSAALKILCNYSWPGNIRELRNTIEYACNMAEGTEIRITHLPEMIINNSIAVGGYDETTDAVTLEEAVETVEKNMIERYLSVYGNSVEQKKVIARELNISMATLYNKIKKYGIEAE